MHLGPCRAPTSPNLNNLTFFSPANLVHPLTTFHFSRGRSLHAVIVAGAEIIGRSRSDQSPWKLSDYQSLAVFSSMCSDNKRTRSNEFLILRGFFGEKKGNVSCREVRRV